MNKEEAKFILSGLRPGARGADDPRLAQALALAEADPELKQWLEEQQGFDRAMIERIGQVQPPPDLQSAILAGIRLSQPLPWWQRRAFLATAAVLVLLAALSVTVNIWDHSSESTFAQSEVDTFRSAMIEQIGRLNQLDFVSAEAVSLRTWLSLHAGDSDYVVPAGLDETRTIGCKILDFRGQRVTLICFGAEPGEMKPTAHLFVLETEAASVDTRPESEPRIAAQGEWTTATWQEGSRTYLLATLGGKQAVQSLLSPS